MNVKYTKDIVCKQSRRTILGLTNCKNTQFKDSKRISYCQHKSISRSCVSFQFIATDSSIRENILNS